jgi:putative transposase
MPRTARASVGGVCYHVLNRGNGKAKIFHKAGDYDAFLSLIAEASLRVQMPLLAYCLMPNHFHLVVLPARDRALSQWMQWLMTAHVRRYHRHYGGCGHVWQGRFKAFPIQQDGHLLNVVRYVERNPVRANLVKRAEDWIWSSLRPWSKGSMPTMLHPWPIDRPKNWLEVVNRAETAAEIEAARRSVNRGAPFGDAKWVLETAQRMGLESSLRPPWRPKKQKKEPEQKPCKAAHKKNKRM